MIVYELDGNWIAETRGGMRNRDVIEPETLKLPVMPEPVVRWTTVEERSEGTGRSVYTRWRAGDVEFVTCSYAWDPAWGYSWEEWWESFADSDLEPPKTGRAFEWNGDGWEEIEHPVRVDHFGEGGEK